MLAINTVPMISKISINNIVVPTDFTVASEAALDTAISIATHYGSKIILVHAEETPPQQHADKFVNDRELHHLSEAEWKLIREADKCADLQREHHLLRGTVAEVVEQFLALDHADLIVLGTHGSSSFRKRLMKSAAEHIFRHVRCPVLVLGPLVRHGQRVWKPKRILLATDLQSDESRTVTYATALADEHDAQLGLLHVTIPQAAPYPEESELVVRPYYSVLLRRLVCDWQRRSSHRTEVWVEFEHDPVAGIIAVANREAIDLLILSVHPDAPWTLNFRHSAQRIIANAPCPTLIVQRDL